MSAKRLRIFAGPNGSGKSTIKDVIPALYSGHYLNPDDIEQELALSSHFSTGRFAFGPLDTVAVKSFFLAHPLAQKAGLESAFIGLQVGNDALTFQDVPINSYVASILTDWLRQMCIRSGQSFTFETVMSSGDKIDVLREAKRADFRIYLYYVATDDPAINLLRVHNRVKAGGHYVPPDKITTRYYRSLNLLRGAIRLLTQRRTGEAIFKALIISAVIMSCTEKSGRHFQSRRGTANDLRLIYQFIKQEESHFVVRLLCNTLEVSKSSYYEYRAGVSFQPSAAEQKMTSNVQNVFCGAARAGKSSALW